MSSSLEASVFMGKNYSENLHSIKSTGNNLTLKQMVHISERLVVGQSDEIFGVSPINWEDSSWKQLSLVNDEEVISLSHAKIYVFSDSVLCLGKVNQNRTSNNVWEESWVGSKVHHNRELWTQLTESRWNSSGLFSQDLPHCSSSTMSKRTKMGDPSQFQGRIIFMSMFNDIIWRSEDHERECFANATHVTLFAKKFSSRTLVIPRTWIRNKVVFYLQRKTTRRMGQSRWIDDDQIWRKRTPSFPSHESIVPRNVQKQRRWKMISWLLCWWRYDWNCFSHD